MSRTGGARKSYADTAVGRVKARLRKIPALRVLVRRRRLRRDQPEWGAFAAELDLRDVARAGVRPRVLIATSVGAHLAGTRVETAIAVALRLRGAEIDVLLCDKDLPACMECEIDRLGGTAEMTTSGPRRRLCPGCFESGARTFRGLGANVLSYGEFLGPDDRKLAAEVASATPFGDIVDVQLDGIAVGEHAIAGTLRFFARATLDGEPDGERVLRLYLEASILTMRAASAVITRGNYVAAVFHHGIYVPQGLIGEVARRNGVRVINWNPAYRSSTFIFSHDNSYHHTLMTEPTDQWEALPWTSGMESDIVDYLRSRWTGQRDWIVFFPEEPDENLGVIEAETGVDFTRPCVGMLTNVMWDAQLHYPANAFPTMLDWCLETIEYFASRPELQLLIRVHPAELRGGIPSRQLIVDEIRAVYPRLPENVFVIGPESRISTYAAMMACDSIIIYGTKTGVELSAMGKRVIVAGEAWVRNKGVTLDAESRDEYFKILERLPLDADLDPKTRERARKYAYHFFFRRMIPLEFMVPTGGRPPYDVHVTDLDQLLPGRSVGLDVVCNGVLHGTPFVYPAEVQRQTSELGNDSTASRSAAGPES